MEVVCADGRGFTLVQEDERATVEVDGRRMMLDRQPLPIGVYYRSQQAALVIDGEFVAFVPRGDAGWRDCHMKDGASAAVPG